MPLDGTSELLAAENVLRITYRKSDSQDGEDNVRGVSEPLTIDINGSDGATLPLEISSSNEILRQKWSRNIEFLLSCIALSVGFGNVWRFPYTAMENGGGTFLMAYLIVLFLIGRPIYYLEMIVGQLSSRGCVKVYDMCPLMRGVGVGQTLTMVIIVGYYAVILAIAVRYFVLSFEPVLPWSVCQPDWDCISSSLINTNITSTTTKQSASLYFTKTITNQSDDLSSGIGTPDWKLAVCLLVCWVAITALTMRGIRSSGKASYFLALFPYVILAILMCRAVTLDGSSEGLKKLFIPQWEKLYTIEVWYAAITQCFFSLTVGLGAVIVFSSFNNFSHNIYRDAMIISWVDTFSSLLSGVIVFGVVGHLAHVTGKPFEKLMANGTTLIFEVYPEVIAKMNFYPNVFAVLFFLMFILLGLGSNMGIVTTILTSVKDRFPNAKTWKVVLGIAIYGFSCGLVYISPGGLHVLGIVDYYGVTFPTLILVILEVITFCWLYGVNRICLDVKLMLGIETGIFWKVSWRFVSLIFLITMVIMQIVEAKELKVPFGYKILAWGLFSFTMLQVIGWAIYAAVQQPEKTMGSKIVGAMKPTADWGPESDNLKRNYDVEVRQLNNTIDNETDLKSRLRRTFLM